jgi:peptidoglycan/xylan/chitin deacetylase (PgdA/CDA1 family)
MAKRKKQKKSLFWPIPIETFFLGVILTLICVLIANYYVDKKNKEDKAQAEKNIIAPYYAPQAFIKPALKITGDAKAKVKLPIIMFHYVEYVKDIKDVIRLKLDINPYIFEKELATLKDNNYETYFVKDIPDILAGNIYYSPKSIVLTFDDGYQDFYTDVYPLLKKYQMRATVFIINDYLGRHGFLNKEEVIELSHSGLVEIAAHTLDHAYLKNIASSAARIEIFESKKQLEGLIGIPVSSFAYPYGAFDQQAVDLVKEASFSAAVSVIPGVFHNEDDLFYLSRIRPGMFNGNNIIQVLESLNN